jgi:hypothetical protein
VIPSAGAISIIQLSKVFEPNVFGLGFKLL